VKPEEENKWLYAFYLLLSKSSVYDAVYCSSNQTFIIPNLSERTVDIRLYMPNDYQKFEQRRVLYPESQPELSGNPPTRPSFVKCIQLSVRRLFHWYGKCLQKVLPVFITRL
jgi:hypothetical protein